MSTARFSSWISLRRPRCLSMFAAVPSRESAAVLLLSALLTACSEPSETLDVPELTSCEGTPTPTRPLRVATYNIKSGLWSSLEEVGDVLEELDADVIALQEVDRLAERTGGVDQAKELAERLEMQHAFAAARTEGSGDYGVALLSRLPFREVRRIGLESGNLTFEPRVALDATLCLGERELRAVSVHADVYPWAAADHARSLVQKLEETARDEQVLRLVAGDLNATPDAAGPLALVAAGLVDIIAALGEAATFLDQRIDYVLADRPLADGLLDVDVIDSDASDHRPVITEMDVGALLDVRQASLD